MKLKIANNVDVTQVFSGSIRAGKTYDWDVTLETHSNYTAPTIRGVASFIVIVDCVCTKSCAFRGRSNGDWDKNEHRQVLEIGGEIANPITSVAKDSLVLTYGDIRSE
jgi:hypothetical protein